MQLSRLNEKLFNSKMVLSCAICKNRSGKDTPLSFHRFPADPKHNERWINAINKDNFKPSKSTVICSAHFKPEDFVNDSGRGKLRKNAIPTIFDSAAPVQEAQELSSDATETNRFIECKMEGSEESDVYSESDTTTCSYESDMENCSFEEMDIKQEVVIIDIPEENSLHTEENTAPMYNVSNEVLETERPQENCSDTESCSTLSCCSKTETECALPVQENPQNVTTVMKRRTSYMGDFTIEDMDCPMKARWMFETAKRTIAKKTKKIKCLQLRSARLEKKVKSLKELLKEINKK